MAKTQALSCLQQATLLLRAGQHEAFRVHSDARSGQPGRIRLRSDEKKEVTQRPAHFVAGIGLPPADRLQHAVAAFETGVSGFPPRANAQSTIDQIDEVAGEIARELEARGRQGLRSRCPSILRHPFVLTAVGSITLGPEVLGVSWRYDGARGRRRHRLVRQSIRSEILTGFSSLFFQRG